MALYTIKLVDIQIYAPLGWYPEEKVLGNHFRVNIEIDVQIKEDQEGLEGTVDYAEVCTLVKEIFSTNNIRLLETVTDNIGSLILARFQTIEKVIVEVCKLHPVMCLHVRAASVQRTFYRMQN